MNNCIRFCFIDGQWNAERSRLNLLPANVIYKTDHGLQLELPSSCVLDTPVHLVFLSTTSLPIPAIHNQFLLGSQSKISLFTEYQLHHPISIITSMLIEQQKDSEFDVFFLDTGNYSAQHDVTLYLRETGARCRVNGLYQLQHENQKIAHHIRVEHLASDCQSAILYSGILDKKSTASFTGKIYVDKTAQKTQSQQANHHLLLSSAAKATSQPELEIYADDIQCTHGATVGQLDQDALFYLRSRGISHPESRQLLIHAFAEHVFSRIQHTEMRAYIKEQAGHIECDFD